MKRYTMEEWRDKIHKLVYDMELKKSYLLMEQHANHIDFHDETKSVKDYFWTDCSIEKDINRLQTSKQKLNELLCIIERGDYNAFLNCLISYKEYFWVDHSIQKDIDQLETKLREQEEKDRKLYEKQMEELSWVMQKGKENGETYNKLVSEKQELYISELNLDELNPQIREILMIDYADPNHKFHNLIDYEFNFLFLNLLKKAPIIICEEKALSIIVNYITSNHRMPPQKSKVRELLDFDTKLLNNMEFLSIINSVFFNSVRSVFYARELVNRPKFMDCFIQYIKQNWKYNDYYSKEKIIYGLNSHVTNDIAIYLGKSKRDWYAHGGGIGNLEKYKQHRRLFNRISKIKNEPKKEELLEWMFDLTDDGLASLDEFYKIPEVRKQLSNKKSLYYQVLMHSIGRDINRYEFCTPSDLFEVRWEAWNSGHQQQMMHYFDSFIKDHYIYFYQDGVIHHVPILSYIKNCRQKLEKYNNAVDIVYGADCTPEERHELEEKYKNDFPHFKELCIQSLTESMDETLDQEEIDEWDRLLEIASIEGKENKSSKTKKYC